MKTAISLFAGAGGCSLGFQQAGYNIKLAIDNNPDAVLTYQTNFPNTLCWQRDITSVSAQDILDAIDMPAGELDFLIGGPPCQGFSSAGARFWDDPRNTLLKQYVRLLEGIQPKWFLMENVEGLLTADHGRYIFEVMRGFIDAGYHVRLHKLYADWYGLPQKRKRVFIVGSRHNTDFTFPPPTHMAGKTLFDSQPVLTIMDGIDDLPDPSSTPDAILSYQQKPSHPYQAMLRGTHIHDHWMTNIQGEAYERIVHLQAGQTMKDLPAHLQHPSFQRRAKRRVMDGTPTEKRGGAPSGIKRLQADQPCLTITSATVREFVHPYQHRYLTLRECARIQSFPDDFIFCGSSSAVIQMIANAIPPMIAKILATHFASCDDVATALVHKQGTLLGYFLTKATSMSPALNRTHQLLNELQAVSE